MLYCIEIKRGGICEEDMVEHHEFNSEPTKEEILNFIESLDCGYNDKYCEYECYPVG